MQWFTSADVTHFLLIESSSDSADDEVAAGGLCDTLAPLDPAAAQAGDASEDDDEVEGEPAGPGARKNESIFNIVLVLLCR